MRTLSLLRHAKSSWDDRRLDDYDRPLAPRGRKAAPAMARHMLEIGLAPDLVVCSGASRTRQTLSPVLASLRAAGREPAVTFDDAVYEAPVALLLRRLRAVPAVVGHVLLVGHNPGLQALLVALLAHPLAPPHNALLGKFPTAALVALELDIADWRGVEPGCGRLRHSMTPRRLEAEGQD